MQEETFNSVAAEQGWDEQSRIIQLMGFINDRGLGNELVLYARQVADEENAEAAILEDWWPVKNEP